jgi:hypothetical protein
MKIDYMGGGKYIGTLRRHDGASVLYGKDRMDILMTLIASAFEKREEKSTDEDQRQDEAQREENYKHQDDDKI